MTIPAGQLIWRCRKYRGLSMRELAERVGTSHNMIFSYEHGEHAPRFDTVMMCLAVCGFTLELKELEEDNELVE